MTTDLIIKMSGEQYNEIIKSLAVVVTEIRIVATPCGLNARAVDTANVTLVNLNLSKSYFESYNGDKSIKPLNKSEFVFAIDVNKYANIKPRKDDRIEWIIPTDTEISEPVAQLIINNRRIFSIKCFDVKTVRKDPNYPEPDLTNKVEIEGKSFYESYRAIAIMSDKMAIEIKGPAVPHLIFSGEGDTDSVKEEIDFEAFSDLGEQRSLFSLDYIKDIAIYLKDKRKIMLEFGEDHPIRITKSTLGQDINSSIMYLLAPRIEAD